MRNQIQELQRLAGACKLYEILLNEGVTFGTILSQLRISLSLLFILSGSTLYLLLTLALVRYCLCFSYLICKRSEHKTFLMSILLNLMCV